MADQDAEYLAAMKVQLTEALDGETFGPDPAQNVLDLVAKAGLVLVREQDFEEMVTAWALGQIR